MRTKIRFFTVITNFILTVILLTSNQLAFCGGGQKSLDQPGTGRVTDPDMLKWLQQSSPPKPVKQTMSLSRSNSPPPGYTEYHEDKPLLSLYEVYQQQHADTFARSDDSKVFGKEKAPLPTKLEEERELLMDDYYPIETKPTIDQKQLNYEAAMKFFELLSAPTIDDQHKLFKGVELILMKAAPLEPSCLFETDRGLEADHLNRGRSLAAFFQHCWTYFSKKNLKYAKSLAQDENAARVLINVINLINRMDWDELINSIFLTADARELLESVEIRDSIQDICQIAIAPYPKELLRDLTYRLPREQFKPHMTSRQKNTGFCVLMVNFDTLYQSVSHDFMVDPRLAQHIVSAMFKSTYEYFQHYGDTDESSNIPVQLKPFFSTWGTEKIANLQQTFRLWSHPYQKQTIDLKRIVMDMRDHWPMMCSQTTGTKEGILYNPDFISWIFAAVILEDQALTSAGSPEGVADRKRLAKEPDITQSLKRIKTKLIECLSHDETWLKAIAAPIKPLGNYCDSIDLTSSLSRGADVFTTIFSCNPHSLLQEKPKPRKSKPSTLPMLPAPADMGVKEYVIPPNMLEAYQRGNVQFGFAQLQIGDGVTPHMYHFPPYEHQQKQAIQSRHYMHMPPDHLPAIAPAPLVNYPHFLRSIENVLNTPMAKTWLDKNYNNIIKALCNSSGLKGQQLAERVKSLPDNLKTDFGSFIFSFIDGENNPAGGPVNYEVMWDAILDKLMAMKQYSGILALIKECTHDMKGLGQLSPPD